MAAQYLTKMVLHQARDIFLETLRSIPCVNTQEDRIEKAARNKGVCDYKL